MLLSYGSKKSCYPLVTTAGRFVSRLSYGSKKSCYSKITPHIISV